MTKRKDCQEYRDHAERLVRGIRAYVEGAVKAGVVLGLSGGVDSALVAKLCKDALGKDNVVCLIMPCGPDDALSTRDALLIAKHLKIVPTTKIVDMTGPFLKLKRFGGNDRERGNIKARLRMTVLYALANRCDALVAGTGNRSEIDVGYFTKYGDGGCDFLPIGTLYKTEVWKMARAVGLPEWVIRKKPTAGLWPGQTDEGELGVSYKKLDIILQMDYSSYWHPDVIAKKVGVSIKKVKRIHAMKKASEHKRCLPTLIY
jgi:NAD+ synthase